MFSIWSTSIKVGFHAYIYIGIFIWNVCIETIIFESVLGELFIKYIFFESII